MVNSTAGGVSVCWSKSLGSDPFLLKKNAPRKVFRGAFNTQTHLFVFPFSLRTLT